MMRIYLFVLIASALFFGCKENETSEQQLPKVDETKELTSLPPSLLSCYLLMYEQDINAIQFSIESDNTVSGYIAYEPFEKDGGRGFFEGQKEGDFITGKLTYMIEGSVQSDEMIFKLVENGISKGMGEYDKVTGQMDISDRSTLEFKDVYEKVDCSKVSTSIANAKAVSKLIISENKK